jgi:1,4-alpha-glucan branching enzyme
MIYLDYGRKSWRRNEFGGNENLDATNFLKRLNTAVFGAHPGAMMIAEESTAFPLVTRPVHSGGLGFNFKWNMGWMNDTLSYAKTDPFFRSHEHHKLTFSMAYAFSENFVLPISHDEVVHGKGTLINKMPGGYELKFAGWRNYLMNMFAHPGKKLTFMGTEFAQFSEWSEARELDWLLLDFKSHGDAYGFFKALSHIYAAYAALYEIEDDWAGFEWLVADDNDNDVIAYERRDKSGGRLIAVFNFSPLVYKGYRIGCKAGKFTVILESDLGGWSEKRREISSCKTRSHGKDFSICTDIKAMSGVYMVSKASAKTEKAEAVTLGE